MPTAIIVPNSSTNGISNLAMLLQSSPPLRGGNLVPVAERRARSRAGTKLAPLLFDTDGKLFSDKDAE